MHLEIGQDCGTDFEREEAQAEADTDWSREVVQGLRGASPWLEQQFDHAAAEAESTVAVRSGKL